MQKIKVSIDGKTGEDKDVYEGYTDDTLPTPCIVLIKEEVIKFLNSSPYDYRFVKHGRIPFLRVYRGERYKDIPSTLISIDDGNVREGYLLEGFDLAEIE
jgi:hypothetical protein